MYVNTVKLKGFNGLEYRYKRNTFTYFSFCSDMVETQNANVPQNILCLNKLMEYSVSKKSSKNLTMHVY